jgi:hypothetical protein
VEVWKNEKSAIPIQITTAKINDRNGHPCERHFCGRERLEKRIGDEGGWFSYRVDETPETGRVSFAVSDGQNYHE